MTKTKTFHATSIVLYFVLEAPRDQDLGLEDCITGLGLRLRSFMWTAAQYVGLLAGPTYFSSLIYGAMKLCSWWPIWIWSTLCTVYICIQYICKKSGWAENSKQWTHCRELFVELWRNLQDTADNDDDGQITVDEWVGRLCMVLVLDDSWQTLLIVGYHANMDSTQGNYGKRFLKQPGDDASVFVETIPLWHSTRKEGVLIGC